MKNLITDVPGVLVGNAQDSRAATGVTVAMFDRNVVASVCTLGGAPGSRAVTLLDPEMMRGGVDAVVLSGGSLYGLDAAGGVTSVLCAQGKGGTFGGIALGRLGPSGIFICAAAMTLLWLPLVLAGARRIGRTTIAEAQVQAA